mmetsp:Transcript_12472/g.20956  ORF Transcript_12472/g.20956 Transcript_12472/m.20956 type:complete len:328 (+) Transcript_12472:25-1008(+)
MFTQAYEQMRDIDLGALRPSQPGGTAPHISFEIYFKNEDVEGMGGPYRQFFSDIAQELQVVQSKSINDDDEDKEEGEAENNNEAQAGDAEDGKQYIGLLCASKNMLRGSDKGKDKFTLNPSKSGSNELSLFNFLGVLMGVCIRTSTNLSINLPSLFWKQLVGQRLAYEDIEELDDGIIEQLREMLECADEEEFTHKFTDRYFTVELSDSTEVELVEGGAKKELTFANRVDYVRKALYSRLTESVRQCEAIKAGINQVIPEALLNIVSSSELEEWIFGKKFIDIELLKRHTKYSNGYVEGDKEIRWFWEILHEFSQEERRKFIRFCYA